MWRKSLEDWLSTTSLSGFNQLYIEQLYEQYALDPNNVDTKWQQLFRDLEEASVITKSRYYDLKANQGDLASNNLIDTYRFYGHLVANIDPLQTWKRNQSVPFNLIDFNIHPDQELTLHKAFLGEKKYIASDLFLKLREIYASSIGYDYSYISNLAIKEWLTKTIETKVNELTYVDRVRMLKRIVRAEELERVLASKFPGAKRFSLEGNESYLIILDTLFQLAANNNYRDIYLGMAHRGRINTMVNIFNYDLNKIFTMFSGESNLPADLYAGDVKYHLGVNTTFRKESANSNTKTLVNNSYQDTIKAHLLNNPSHLEFVNALVMGAARATESFYNQLEGQEEYTNRGDFSVSKATDYVLPIYTHGDSALAGQGIVQELLNMSNTRAYSVGGGIHIVINNQIGFTTSDTRDTRATTYATDIARMIDAPVFHVNAEDLDAIVHATELAFAYRQRYKKDVFIDLVGYRRNGHNEADDPRITQPLMYEKIKGKELISEVYARHLVQQGIIESDYLSGLRKQVYADLFAAKPLEQIGNLHVAEVNYEQENFVKQEMTLNGRCDLPVSYNKFSARELTELATQVISYPDTYPIPSTLEKMYSQRLLNVNDGDKLQWGHVELLAYAALLHLGKNIRISGEDVGRGTFFHRGAVLHHLNRETDYIPLLNVAQQANRKFEIWDSTLSETGVLGFEYGYSITSAETLVLWEAQFGDFANVAQPIIDQFIVAGETKWDQTSNMTLLLPHGYEGQGAEHSSARVERFLQLCANNNLRVVVPTTATNLYHILVNQGLNPIRKPLVLFTPKSLLRNELASASIAEIANSEFSPIYQQVVVDPSKVTKLVITNGRIRFDVQSRLATLYDERIAQIHIEQLYPFPSKELVNIFNEYPNLQLIEWVQDEPENMGAWSFAFPQLLKLLGSKLGSVHFNFNGRPASATTATANSQAHKKELETILDNLTKFDNYLI